MDGGTIAASRARIGLALPAAGLKTGEAAPTRLCGSREGLWAAPAGRGSPHRASFPAGRLGGRERRNILPVRSLIAVPDCPCQWFAQHFGSGAVTGCGTSCAGLHGLPSGRAPARAARAAAPPPLYTPPNQLRS